MMDTGCEEAIAAMRGWIAAIGRHDIEYLKNILSEDYQYNCSPEIYAQGRMDKTTYIQMNEQMDGTDVLVRDIVARRYGDVVAMLLLVEIHERLGVHQSSIAEETARACEAVNGKTLTYASAWRNSGQGWVCFSHSALGAISEQ
jgi:hypothetical protein